LKQKPTRYLVISKGQNLKIQKISEKAHNNNSIRSIYVVSYIYHFMQVPFSAKHEGWFISG